MPCWNPLSAFTAASPALVAGVALLLASCRTMGGPSEHVPFAARSCSRCHDTRLEHADPSMPAPGAEAGLQPDERTASLLRIRADKLCFGCHASLSSLRDSGKNWLHGPFAAGACLACHEPHESDNPKLLRAYPWHDLCAQCHPGYHGGQEASGHAGECRSCHHPHAAEKPFPGGA